MHSPNIRIGPDGDLTLSSTLGKPGWPVKMEPYTIYQTGNRYRTVPVKMLNF
ncbi:MAG: hypothetical protein LUQ34_01830 [Euryarchaeota archaeon]|nr:hypothetical protein [Euryarchaeota archaeon]